MSARKLPPRDPVTKRFVKPSAVAAEPERPHEPAHAIPAPDAEEVPVGVPDAATVTVTAAPEGGLITVEDRAALLQRIPPWARGILYISVAVGSVLVGYGASKHMIGVDEVVLWLGITSASGVLATGNLRV